MIQKISRRSLAKVVAARLADPKENKERLARSLAAYLLDRKMTDQVEMLVGDVAYELSQDHVHLFATVTSARELSEALLIRVRDLLQRTYDIKAVELATEIDPTLVGGMKVQTPDAALDLSVRAKLRRLQQA
ncbi:MAG TPA: F0F1 ATP synthase subunit delta [Candidatus Saccharimonadales bacterium]|nr:F0F1 ATP synthase subunit delta [Candidatus Saccharimonadales bacterium]